MTKDKHIFIKNIYYMLSYAFTALKEEKYEDVVGEDFEHLHDLFAAILAKGIGKQLKQGLYREYVNHAKQVTALRGKINMPGTIRNQLAHKRVLVCEFDDLSENNLLNQVLKTTVTLLLRQAKVKEVYKTSLRREMMYFSEIDLIEPSSVRWEDIRFQRNNQTYRMLLGVCRLVWDGMLQTTDGGDLRLMSFIDEQRMHRLYEKFILEFYAQECPQVKAEASQIPWALDDGISTLLPIMQSDITLSQGSTVLIIDAKYYSHTMQSQYSAYTLHSNNLYQIFTYVKNRDASFDKMPHTVSGMLLYARTDEAIQPDNEYMMSGSKISVRTLDLNREFTEIAQQLREIVRTHFDY